MTITNGIILAPVSADGTPEVNSTGELIVNWAQIKAFNMVNLGCFLNYMEFDTYYYIWMCYRSQKFYIPELLKSTTDATDFETNFKSSCNIPQAVDMRLSTCRYGRKLYSKYVTFHTSTTAGYNNDNYLGQDSGDVTYTMVDADGNVTTNENLCVQSIIDFESTYSMEIAGGDTSIPSTLPGDQDLWALYVVGAPDYPKQFGGSIEFISNPRLKWDIGKRITEDESLNPANIEYIPGYHFTKIRWIIKHPAGAKAEFQIHMRIYKRPID